MKIFAAAQVRTLDQYTIAHEPIVSIELMERASRAFADAFAADFDPPRRGRVHVFCGDGNNGGDGLAIARLLAGRGYATDAWVLRQRESGSPDFESNLRRWQFLRATRHLTDDVAFPTLTPDDIIVDALFGAGLSRPVSGRAAQLIAHLNAQPSPRVSVDIASGLFADQPTDPDSAVFRPQRTYTFQFPKLAFFAPENHAFVGQWQALDIGLHPDAIAHTPTPYHYLTPPLAAAHWQPRRPFTHKGTYGHALLVAGQRGQIGAAMLAAHACLRGGAGLTTALVPACGYGVLQTALPEVMTLTAGEDHLTALPDLLPYDVIGAGPGLGQHADTRAVVAQLLGAGKPLVLDADALNLLAADQDLLAQLPAGSVLTPHPKEFARLAGETTDFFARLARLRAFAQTHQVCCLLKGYHTAVAAPDGTLWFNGTGNAGLAKGGTGDALTGLITALRAQGYGTVPAALLGVYLHGRAGDLTVAAHSPESLTATDVIHHFGKAYAELLAMSHPEN